MADAAVSQCSCRPEGDWFVDVTDQTHIDFRPRRGAQHYEGGGVAIVDLNGDGLLDLMVAGDQAGIGVFLGTGAFTFEDRSLQDVTDVLGFAATDIDRDGADEVVLLRDGIETLFRFNGEASAELLPLDGAAPSAYVVSGAFGDVDRDGVPELATGGGIQRSIQGLPTGSPNRLWVYDPKGATWSNNAPTDFTLGSATTLAMTWMEESLTGRPALFVAQDFGPLNRANAVLVGQSNGSWQDWATPLSLDHEIMSMGVAVLDADRDGQLDYYITNVGANVLAMRRGSAFADEARQRGADVMTVCDPTNTFAEWPSYDAESTDPLTSAIGRFAEGYLDTSRPDPAATSWSAVAFDYDNDGDEDIFVTNGFVGLAALNIPEAPHQGDVLLTNTGDGRFRDDTVGSGLGFCGDGRGAAAGDFDGDGDLDLVVVDLDINGIGAVRVYRNDIASGNFIGIRLRGEASTADGLGARIIVDTGSNKLVRLVSRSVGHASTGGPIHHFGLGTAKTVEELRVEWPSGISDTLTGIPANSVIDIAEGAASIANTKAHPPLGLRMTGR